ncbi:hypothetical protein DFH08DRAFT_894833 [Mycena albidolilacea]|uniref:Uncharacterized protein n=1 Tax=Mycena albidolilacea TaxID=1033008 RepID=A0AAD7EEP3_9AGAR|nr:hypothetical protein DFH08DRAFT_894833 [Mycena albidolilacea]
MHRSFIVLLCLGFVRAILQNITVDDTSPDIVYGEATFQCNATVPCPDGLKAGVFNESATLTFSSIAFNFTGVAFYASLDVVGAATIILDGEELSILSNPLSDVLEAGPGQGSHNISKTGLANIPHTLTIAPNTTLIPPTIIGFDHLIYTASLPDKKSHVGAIVGGVLAGVAVIFGLLLAALFARRRKLILRRNQRKSAVLRGMTVARQNHNAGEEDAKELPT